MLSRTFGRQTNILSIATEFFYQSIISKSGEVNHNKLKAVKN